MQQDLSFTHDIYQRQHKVICRWLKLKLVFKIVRIKKTTYCKPKSSFFTIKMVQHVIPFTNHVCQIVYVSRSSLVLTNPTSTYAMAVFPGTYSFQMLSKTSCWKKNQQETNRFHYCRVGGIVVLQIIFFTYHLEFVVFKLGVM